MAMPGADDDVTINQANRGGTSTLNPMANTQPTTDITPPGPPATTTKAAPQQEPTPSATPADNTPTPATAATNGNEANAALPTAPVPPEPAPTAAARRGSLAPEANGGTDERRPSAESDEESDGKVRKLDYRKAALLEQQLKVGGNTMNTDDDTGGDVEDEKYRARGGPNSRFVCYHDELGSGAFKTVYKGMDVEEAVEVAWNEMKVQRLSEADKKRLDAEVALLQKLRHRHVVQFFGNWTVIKGGQEHRVFITELMTSGTLKQFLRDTGAPKHEVLQKWCKQILSALKYMHDKGIIHRDLKCDNIFIEGTTGEVKIGDLGLAMVYKEFGPKSSVIGTPEFMAPEMYREEYSFPIDVWAFGMCVLEMITLEYPYSECTNPAQIYRKVSQGIKPAAFSNITGRNAAVRRDFVLKCIKLEPSERATVPQLQKHDFFKAVADDSTKRVDLAKTTINVAKVSEDGIAEMVLRKHAEGEDKKRITFTMDVFHEDVGEMVESMVSEGLIAHPDKNAIANTLKVAVTTAKADAVRIKTLEAQQAALNGDGPPPPRPPPMADFVQHTQRGRFNSNPVGDIAPSGPTDTAPAATTAPAAANPAAKQPAVATANAVTADAGGAAPRSPVTTAPTAVLTPAVPTAQQGQAPAAAATTTQPPAVQAPPAQAQPPAGQPAQGPPAAAAAGATQPPAATAVQQQPQPTPVQPQQPAPAAPTATPQQPMQQPPAAAQPQPPAVVAPPAEAPPTTTAPAATTVEVGVGTTPDPALSEPPALVPAAATQQPQPQPTPAPAPTQGAQVPPAATTAQPLATGGQGGQPVAPPQQQQQQHAAPRQSTAAPHAPSRLRPQPQPQATPQSTPGTSQPPSEVADSAPGSAAASVSSQCNGGGGNGGMSTPPLSRAAPFGGTPPRPGSAPPDRAAAAAAAAATAAGHRGDASSVAGSTSGLSGAESPVRRNSGSASASPARPLQPGQGSSASWTPTQSRDAAARLATIVDDQPYGHPGESSETTPKAKGAAEWRGPYPPASGATPVGEELLALPIERLENKLLALMTEGKYVEVANFAVALAKQQHDPASATSSQPQSEPERPQPVKVEEWAMSVPVQLPPADGAHAHQGAGHAAVHPAAPPPATAGGGGGWAAGSWWRPCSHCRSTHRPSGRHCPAAWCGWCRCSGPRTGTRSWRWRWNSRQQWRGDGTAAGGRGGGTQCTQCT